ncbi:MAG: hypothetical protein RJA83_163 [Pseudomonadota bacterium]|jgi:hypothetical protein
MDTIEIAVESFNQLGLANIRYAMDMGTLPGKTEFNQLSQYQFFSLLI